MRVEISRAGRTNEVVDERCPFKPIIIQESGMNRWLG